MAWKLRCQQGRHPSVMGGNGQRSALRLRGVQQQGHGGGSSLVVMQGAATLGEHRGHGIYTAMVAARVADARALGKEAAVLQGDRKTSAPICVKLGFAEVCSVDLYVWAKA